MRIPATPWMPSIITAQKSPSDSFSSTALMSLRGTNSTFGVWLNGDTILGLSVAATAPDVLPWNELLNASTFLWPVWNDASLNAFSLASAPELQRNRL